MSVEPIRVTLSSFEKLHVLREQLEERQEELARVESDIREGLSRIETQRYLESLSPYYSANPLPGLPTADQIQAMEQRRALLKQLIATVEQTMPAVMQQAGQEPQPAANPAAGQPAGPARKVRFDSFDDFVSAKQ